MRAVEKFELVTKPKPDARATSFDDLTSYSQKEALDGRPFCRSRNGIAEHGFQRLALPAVHACKI
jgi:hypothetical protein